MSQYGQPKLETPNWYFLNVFTMESRFPHAYLNRNASLREKGTGSGHTTVILAKALQCYLEPE